MWWAHSEEISHFYVVFPPQTDFFWRLMKHRDHVRPTALNYWLTNLVRGWNQSSEDLHRDKQNNHDKFTITIMNLRRSDSYKLCRCIILKKMICLSYIQMWPLNAKVLLGEGDECLFHKQGTRVTLSVLRCIWLNDHKQARLGRSY